MRFDVGPGEEVPSPAGLLALSGCVPSNEDILLSVPDFAFSLRRVLNPVLLCAWSEKEISGTFRHAV